MSRGGLQKWLGDWSISSMRKGWEIWACLAWRRADWERILWMPLITLRVGVKTVGPNSFQWCPETGEGAMNTKWNRGSSSWTYGKTSLSGVWQHTGTVCPEGVSLSGDIKILPGCGPVQPALGKPDLAGGLGLMISRGPFQPLPLCDSEKSKVIIA